MSRSEYSREYVDMAGEQLGGRMKGREEGCRDHLPDRWNPAEIADDGKDDEGVGADAELTPRKAIDAIALVDAPREPQGAKAIPAR